MTDFDNEDVLESLHELSDVDLEAAQEIAARWPLTLQKVYARADGDELVLRLPLHRMRRLLQDEINEARAARAA